MKPEPDDQIDAEGDLGKPIECSLAKLQRPEIVGEVANPMLDTMRRLWWRAFDRACFCFVVIPLLIIDRIYGPEPPTPADLKREADHERLVRALPLMGKTIKPRKPMPGKVETTK